MPLDLQDACPNICLHILTDVAPPQAFNTSMTRFVAFVLLAALVVLQAPANAQARYYNQGELDALLAPVALYPDPLLSHVLIAATYPDDLHEAAAWSRANPQLTGEDAVRAADSMLWHESVKALLAFPNLLYRMDESPQWTADLGAAFLAQQPQVMDTMQGLRRRAQASGYLQPSEQYSVQQQGQAIAIYPVQPQVIYVPYYDPYVVYGPWWWSSNRPVYWRPWYPRPAVFVSAKFFSGSLDWHRRHITHVAPRQIVIQQVQPVTIHHRANPAARPIVQGTQFPRGSWRAREVERRKVEQRDPGREHRIDGSRPVSVFNHVQQAPLARPIVQAAQILPQMAVRKYVQNTRPIAQVAQVPPQVQRPVQHRVEAPRPVAVQQPMHQAQVSRPAVQGGHFQQRRQGSQHRGGRD